MPEQQTVERAREDAREGKSPSTQAGEFGREEIHHVREGKHGARSPQQAIAIGLSKARRAGIKLSPPRGKKAVRIKAAQDERASKEHRQPSKTRSRATEGALRHESRKSANSKALSQQAERAAASRGKKARRQAAEKAARTRKAA
ncbi:MAG: DNA-binding protein [Candidatus Sulfotelmatobacter sp.]